MYICIYVYMYISGLNPRQLASLVYYRLVSYSCWLQSSDKHVDTKHWSKIHPDNFVVPKRKIERLSLHT